MTDDDYTPYGLEWEQILMKTPKKFIIGQYRKSCLLLNDLEHYQIKLSMLINFVNQEMGNTVEWTGDHWQWKK